MTGGTLVRIVSVTNGLQSLKAPSISTMVLGMHIFPLARMLPGSILTMLSGKASMLGLPIGITGFDTVIIRLVPLLLQRYPIWSFAQ